MCARSYEGLVVSRKSHGDEAHGDCAGFGWWNRILVTFIGILKEGWIEATFFRHFWLDWLNSEGLKSC